MIDIQAIFKNKRPDRDKLSSFGFSFTEGLYVKDFPILQGQFSMKVTLSPLGELDYHVYDLQAEEYFLARVQDAEGAFVGEVHKACEEVFSEIAQNCFSRECYQNGQTKRILQYVFQKYGVEPEFLWARLPDWSALRVKRQKPWFAVLGKVEKSKFGFEDNTLIEVLDLKGEPDTIAESLKAGHVYPAYHMNKRNWYSVFPDDTLPDEQLFSMIDISYTLAGKK